MTLQEVCVVVPGDIDDAEAPSGGNHYDRRLCEEFAASGRPVRELAVPGTWPRPGAAARGGLARMLAALPAGSVVLLDGLVACGVPEIVVPETRRLRIAVLVHLPLADEPGQADLDAAERDTLEAAGAVVATSPWARDHLVAHHGLEPSRVHAVTPGTDPAPLATGTDGATRLLCVASVTPRKGHDLLVEALAAVAHLPWRCECVGPLRRDPDHVTRLRRLIAGHRVGDRVHLEGPLTGKRLDDAYAAADLTVLTSRAETYGMVVTEALARGVPVLATSVDGVPGTLGQDPTGAVPGLLVPPDDPAALAAALRRWLTEPDLRGRLRAAARRRRGALPGWDDTARRMATVLSRLRRGIR
ncbi:glycosyltransferase involved in cell wall biosynthesis [Actinomadura pelletieri DSM 43383]|uniref:Glycosyltransferase involved in cell wall biosynthesis n=1 Tax=Actinomadura pelletieri DSM 43383 TaxID=1120940 RepID=A0A495QBC6_9ACTN|nr:glycosyltransferase family 4 protein [Actinomadura pelletieri]RKS68841.1 glycosyltransferase involved in cell wall biosynthesis [Actinomadura pelletieri DSM 43383]